VQQPAAGRRAAFATGEGDPNVSQGQERDAAVDMAVYTMAGSVGSDPSPKSKDTEGSAEPLPEKLKVKTLTETLFLPPDL